MENNEIKNNAGKLNDEDLENVNGGLLKPIILDAEDGIFGNNLKLNDDALGAVTGGSVSVESAPFESAPYLCQCPKCGRFYESGSSCMHCLVRDTSLNGFTKLQQ